MSIPTRRAALLVAATLTAATLTACSTSSDGSMPGTDHSATPMTTTMANDAGRAGDVGFAQMMTPHHQQAIEMAGLALARPTASATVRKLATDIKAAQDPEITTMRGWLTTWGAPTTASGMNHGSGMMTETDMAKLKAAEGAEFDRMWLAMMIAHHQGAVTMAQQVLTTTKDTQVKSLAEAIIKAQNAEITTMQGLL